MGPHLVCVGTVAMTFMRTVGRQVSVAAMARQCITGRRISPQRIS